ncbi:MAG: hypothetical protein CW338_10135 [Clostridiales bacterium]|nr:hypothetical protein [Clostridiales bacterium]
MKYYKRIIWFICSRLFIACCVLGLMITAFYYAMNASNIYVVLKDGMAKRAQVIMMGENRDEMGRYFTPSYIQGGDPDLANGLAGNNPYLYYYDITGFDHRLEMKWVWCWPWEDVAQATVVERIPAIDGKIKSSVRTAALEAGYTASPPAWKTVKYTVTLVKKDGRWIVTEMNGIEVIN